MALYFVIRLLAVLCAVGISTQQAIRRCYAQDQCLPDECCSKRIFRPEAYCVPKRKLGEICINDELGSTLYNDVYDITCPCGDKLRCRKESTVGIYGEIYSHGNARCVPENFYRSYRIFPGSSSYASSNSNGGYAGSNANSGANAVAY